ncbi:MAG: hypothetical protein FWD14_07905 [Treponema sp.]|nr:hypothetical protein [Treponema sp.]
MVKTKKVSGLSLKQVKRIKSVQKKQSVIDPGCEKLTPEEFINWHPIGGMSWEERAQRMKAAGILETKPSSKIEISENQLAVAVN